jgi:hypothetical protein
MPNITRIDRSKFLSSFWDYQPGEHVTSIMPTGGGKTHMSCQLLQHTPIPATMLVMKPRDAVPAEWTRRLGYKEIPAWPPPAKWPWEPEPAGYTLWPRQSLKDLDADDKLLADQFGKALLHAYRNGDQIVFADEVGGLCELRLQKHLKALWMRGRGMGAGLWAATQKPSGDQGGPPVPTYLYSAATHLFLGYDRTVANRARFGEIGGVDGRMIEDIVMGLRLHPITSGGVTNYVSDQLYVRKGGPEGAYMCVVGP